MSTIILYYRRFVKGNNRKFIEIYTKSAYLICIIYKTGLAQLDAEGGIWVSSAYVGTVESQIATKKPHTIEEIHRKFGGFQHFKNIDSIIQLKSVLNFKVGFCSALNEPAPYLNR